MKKCDSAGAKMPKRTYLDANVLIAAFRSDEALASNYDLSPMDALHASAAIHAGVDEFVTLEKPEKPLCRVPDLTVLSLYRQPTST